MIYLFLPTTYSSTFLQWRKDSAKRCHSGFPCQTFIHCKVFVPAAPRRACTHVFCSQNGKVQSVSSMLAHHLHCSQCLRSANLRVHLRAIALTTRTDYSLVEQLSQQRANPPQSHPSVHCCFGRRGLPAIIAYRVLFPLSQGYPRLKGRLTTCY